MNEQEFLLALKPFTIKHQTQFYERDSNIEVVAEPIKNKVSNFSQPLFLKRNYRQMKQLRKQRDFAVLDQRLTARVLPQMSTMVF